MNISFSGLITSVGEERDRLLVSLLFRFEGYFLFLWMLRIGFVILLWHSLDLPYGKLVIS